MFKLYINILSLFMRERIIYNKYKEYIDLKYIKEYLPELYKLYIVLYKYYDSNITQESISIDEFEILLYSNYPSDGRDKFSDILKTLASCNPDGSNFRLDYLNRIRSKAIASTIVDLGVQYVECDSERELDLSSKLANAIISYQECQINESKDDQEIVDTFVSISEEIENEVRSEKGFRWSLDSLNKALGSLRKGDFGFIVARPETGKTTFLADQCSFFVSQREVLADGKILWINNEERSSKVGYRIYQSALAKGYNIDTLKDISLPRDLVHTKRDVEDLCRSIEPKLIIIDQLDKIKGFDGDRYDLELKKAYAWARELSAKYGPVIGVCQASASADNKKWVGMNDVDSSKTGKQGEADWILGIGKTDNEESEFVRYFYLSKNKLLGDEDTDPARRHDRWTVKILPEKAIYEDF